MITTEYSRNSSLKGGGRDKLNNVVFITGATGFLGTQIVRRLIKKENCDVMVLVRGKNDVDAYRHLSRALWEWPELMAEIGRSEKVDKSLPGSRVHIINGDIFKERLGLKKEQYNDLIHKITHVIHSAADIRLNASLEELRRINVQGTVNLLKLAVDAHKHHGIKRFSHVSTAYVAGGQKGVVYEDKLSSAHGFMSNYERSKYEGELEVRNSDLPISIFRPGMIVGDSETGYVKTFNTVYVLLRHYLNGQLRFLPVSPDVKINLVPVDYVADAVSNLTFDQCTEGMTFHLTAPYKYLPTVKELIDFVNKWAMDNMDLKLPKPIYLPLPPSFIPKLAVFNGFVGTPGRNLIKTIKELAPYLNEDREFSRNNVKKYIDHYQLRWEKFLPEILNYAVYNGFFHRSERTVYEQVLFRLKSRSRPINYYDVEEGSFMGISSTDIRKDILAALNSLKMLGIGPGDRVAMVGFNTTRYLTLDVAVGLLGAISVPLYYTSPVDEINEILNDCGASLLFVGTPQLLEKSMKLERKKHIISFCSESVEVPSDVMSWNDFINQRIEAEEDGKGEKSGSELDLLNDITTPVDFNDIATIRYTSGTTGKPSGVTFTHGNLRWMAEFIASMPPWIDRTHKISYLSFLPMNHVVEGILGTYAPYYAPAPLELYFLEDFQDLQNTLHQVKPTIFFSVPRFYEKVWSRIQQSKMGHMYLQRKEGLVKDILRIMLRRGLLKQAGLDVCAQLIVGSAPISEDLLRSYHELGVEVHNAYGLTEAPLVTINCLGFNRIGTVGEPLPHTDVETNEDGEVIVRGPQVTPGYFNDAPQNRLLFQNNWLLTGDYGYLTPEGSLVITGRKKEMIVNSYGKSISPLKIEAILKDINGVSEVMVVGDEKPYCISIIWVDEDDVNFKEISIAIKVVNSKLSNPEKIKRWAILKNNLTIENGDLTANLKLKRNNILNRHIDLINFIYDSKCEEEIPGELSKLKITAIGGEGKNHEY